MGIKDRSAKRRTRIVAHQTASFKDAEEWDLDFWQHQSPEQRLSALMAIRSDIEKVAKGRLSSRKAMRKGR